MFEVCEMGWLVWNDAQYGNTMANRFHEDEFDMSGSIFDVYDCGNEESAVSSIWVKVEPAASVDYDDGVGQLCAFTAPNVYVDPTIDQECLDEGCGFPNNPFKTISKAINPLFTDSAIFSFFSSSLIDGNSIKCT